jgi:hypothetical protein
MITTTVASSWDPYSSETRLQELGFDPIEALVKQHAETEALIQRLLLMPKVSMVTIGNLANTKTAIASQLLKYGYSALPTRALPVQQTQINETDIVTITVLPPPRDPRG